MTGHANATGMAGGARRVHQPRVIDMSTMADNAEERGATPSRPVEPFRTIADHHQAGVVLRLMRDALEAGGRR